jgi:hypothetical protein
MKRDFSVGLACPRAEHLTIGSLLDEWAESHARRAPIGLDSGRLVPLHVDGRGTAFPAVVFHDGLNHAYLELARQVADGTPAWGHDSEGSVSAAAVRGFANRRLHSRIVDELRKVDRLAPLADQLHERTDSASTEAVAIDRADAVGAIRALASLSDGDRRLVLLSADGLDGVALGQELSISPSAARQRLSRAHRRLRAIAEHEELKEAA